MNTILLLDLENTIIWDWTDDPRLMCARFPVLKEWVCSHLGPETRVGLLSMAVWDERDLDIFNTRGIRHDIEITHKFKFDDELIFIRDELLPKFREWLKMPWLDADDFTAFMKKTEMVMHLWLKELAKPDTKVILFDDTVPDLVITHSTIPNCTLELVDPWTIIKRDLE